MLSQYQLMMAAEINFGYILPFIFLLCYIFDKMWFKYVVNNTMLIQKCFTEFFYIEPLTNAQCFNIGTFHRRHFDMLQ